MFKLAKFDSCFTSGYVSSHGHTTWSAKCRGTSTGCTSWAPEDGRNTQAWSSKRVESWLLIIGGLERKTWCGGNTWSRSPVVCYFTGVKVTVVPSWPNRFALRMRLTWHLELRMIWDWQMSATIFSDEIERKQQWGKWVPLWVAQFLLESVMAKPSSGKPTFAAMTQRSCGHRYAKP